MSCPFRDARGALSSLCEAGLSPPWTGFLVESDLGVKRFFDHFVRFLDLSYSRLDSKDFYSRIRPKAHTDWPCVVIQGVPGTGIEPARGQASREFKSLASTNFATPATRAV